MKKTMLLVVSIVTVFVLASCCAANLGDWQAEYDLAMKFLDEGNYEEAVIAFTKAIKIDNKSVVSYIGRAKAYTGLAEESTDLEKAEEYYTKALADCEKAISLGDTSCEEMKANIEKALEAVRAAMEYEDLLKVMYEHFVADDMDAAIALMRSEEYLQINENIETYLLYTGNEGKTLSVYPGNYYYFGDFVNGVREGDGKWIYAVTTEESALEQYIYDGQWANDKPNGEGKILEIYDRARVEAFENDITRVEITGQFLDGLYHGEINETWDTIHDGVLKWSTINTVNGVYSEISPAPQYAEYESEKAEYGEYMVARADDASLWSNGRVNSVKGFDSE